MKLTSENELEFALLLVLLQVLRSFANDGGTAICVSGVGCNASHRCYVLWYHLDGRTTTRSGRERGTVCRRIDPSRLMAQHKADHFGVLLFPPFLYSPSPAFAFTFCIYPLKKKEINKKKK